MKGEIFRRMSMELNLDNIQHVGNRAKKVESDKDDDDDDYLVKTIGSFGLWQAVISITGSLTRAIALWNMSSLSFLTPAVEFLCVEFRDNDTMQDNNTSVVNTCYSNCLKYNYSSQVGRSIVEDFGLICENAWLASLAQSVLMMGLLVGVGLFGWISDRFGRRAALLPSTFINAVFMIVLPFSSSYIVFTSLRFVIGVASGGSLLIGIVQILETIGKEHRETVGTCTLIPDGLAQASLAGFSYYTSDWQGYTLGYGLATCVIFVLLLFMPESPRWLVSNGKIDEAVKVISRAATRNKLDTSNIRTIVTKAVEDIKLKDGERAKLTYLDFFKSKEIFITTLSMFMIWITMGMCFFGIYQYVTIIGFDPYLSVLIMGFIQVPVCPLSIIINKISGRKVSLICLALLTAMAMIAITFSKKGNRLGTTFGFVAFTGVSISFCIAYIYISELYPTPLRHMAYGLSSSGAKIGAMVSPFLANLEPRWLTSLIFSIFLLILVLCCFVLPETKGRNLKDTLKQ